MPETGFTAQHARAPTVPVSGGAAERMRVAFFRSFIPLLRLFVAAAEWASLAWVLHVFGVGVPVVLHIAAPPLFYFLNLRIIARRGAQRSPFADAAIRGYVALAFTSIFCALVLLLAGIVWLVGSGLGALAGVSDGVRDAIGTGYYWFVNAGLATVAGLLCWGYTFGRRELAISRIEVPVPDLPPDLDGFRIVHLSDVHIGSYLDLAELDAHIARVQALAPDLVCITGDIVDRPETCAHAFPTLARLRARHGVIATLGNHDFYAGADVVTNALRELTPFTVLRNDVAFVLEGTATLAIAGVDDLGRDWARGALEHPALPELASAAPPGAPLVVLSHRPDCFPQAARLGAVLQLSGHTHGGQVALPPLPGRLPRNLAEFISPFHRGLYRDGNATLYVNRGLGFTGQKIRLFTAREIAVLTLRAAAPRACIGPA